MPLRLLDRMGYSEPVQDLAIAELTGEVNICPDPVGDLHYSLNLSTGRCDPFLYSREFTSPTLLEQLPGLAIKGVTTLASGGVSLLPTLAAGFYEGIADEPLAPEAKLAVGLTTLAAGAPMNGFSDIFGDIGAFFNTEQTFGETLSNVGTDLWQGVSNILPSAVPNLTSPLMQTLSSSSAPPQVPQLRRTPTPTYSPGQFLLPQFLRTPEATPFTGVPPGSALPGAWERDTYGEPGTMGMMTGGGAAMMVPAVRGMGTIALQTVVNAMRTQGLRASVGWLVGIIRKFGPAAAVGFLASFVEDQIAQRAVWESYTVKRRRMNPGNVKALRRSARRIESFHRLCRRVDVLRGRGQTRRRSKCSTCHRDPCRCK